MEDHAKTPFWLWLNLLSLDAPLVALVWQDFLSRCYPLTMRLPGRLVLGLTVWAIYLADRLIDVRHLAADDETTRHKFYRRNSGLVRILFLGVLFADLLTASLWLRPAVFWNGLAVGVAVCCYLSVFAFGRVGAKRWKQPVAALLFAIGVFLIAWTQVPSPWRLLGWPAAAFSLLCWGNLVLIESWDENQSVKHRWIGLLLFALLCAAVGNSWWYAAIAASAAVLALIDFSSLTLRRDSRRVLADVALLTPLLFR